MANPEIVEPTTATEGSSPTADDTTTGSKTSLVESNIDNTSSDATDNNADSNTVSDLNKHAEDEATNEDVSTDTRPDVDTNDHLTVNTESETTAVKEENEAENHWSEPSSPKEHGEDSGVKTTEDVGFSDAKVPTPPESPQEQRKVSTVGDMDPSDETKTEEAWSAPVSDDDEKTTEEQSKAEAVAGATPDAVGQTENATDADVTTSDTDRNASDTEHSTAEAVAVVTPDGVGQSEVASDAEKNATDSDSAAPAAGLAGAAVGVAAAEAEVKSDGETKDSAEDASASETVDKDDHIEEVAAVAAAAAAGAVAGAAIAESKDTSVPSETTSVVETTAPTDTTEASVVETTAATTESADTVGALPAAAGVAAIAAAADDVTGDKTAEKLDEERRQSHGAQRAMALAGGKAAAGIKDEQIEGAAFKLDLPVEVPGDTDPEAYRKCAHLLNEARKKHTIQELHEVQLTGVLPMTKGLTDATNKAHKRCHKLQARIEKDAAAEEKDRMNEIATVEKRLTKELNFLHKTMSADNYSKPADERKEDNEVMMRARKLKWPHFSEFDRLIAHQHLEDMKYLYRLRLLYFISINETVHATEWAECDKIEAEEFAALHKYHAAEEKKLDKETHWGITSKITGKKEINGNVVKKADYPQVVEEEKAKLAETFQKETEEKKAMQAKRRVDLEDAQNKIIQELITKQSDLLKNIKSDDRY